MSSKTPAQFIVEALANHPEFQLRTYSGRGMYGKECLAVSTETRCGGEDWDVAGVLFSIDPAMARQVRAPRVDSLGMGSILYWPGVSMTDEELEMMLQEVA